MWIVDRWLHLLLLLLPSPEESHLRGETRDNLPAGGFKGTWLTAGLGVFLDLVSSFFSAASFLPPKLDLGVEGCWDLAVAGTGV